MVLDMLLDTFSEYVPCFVLSGVVPDVCVCGAS